MSRYTLYLFGCFIFLQTNMVAQNNNFNSHQELKWNDEQPDANLSFEGAVFQPLTGRVPCFATQVAVPSDGELRVQLLNPVYKRLLKPLRTADQQALTEEAIFTKSVDKARELYYGKVVFPALRKSIAGDIEKLVSFDIQIIFLPKNNPLVVTERGPNTFTSVLSEGEIYKFAISETKLYKLDYDFLKNKLKINNLDNINPKKIHIYGNGGAMLPEPNSELRTDDLAQNAVFIKGESDGKFDANDFILFYAQGSNKWTYRNSAEGFVMTKNLYSDQAFYYLKIENTDGLRLNENTSLSNTSGITNTFDDYARYEDDKVNLLNKGKPSTQGSGKNWYGDNFLTTREKTYPNLFVFPNIVTTEPIALRSAFAGRSNGRTQYQLTLNGNIFTSPPISETSVGNGIENFAYIGKIDKKFTTNSDNINVTLNFLDNGQFSEGWLDFIELNARRQLKMSGGQMGFRDARTMAQPTTTFEIENGGADLTIWNVTNFNIPFLQTTNRSGNTTSFGATTQNILQEFVAFQPDATLAMPTAVGKVDNQNLHGLDNLDMVIIYPKEFETATQQLATHRRQHSNLEVATIRVDKIYEEFSSGAQDVTAIRDFIKMLYNRNPQRLKYVLLMGDGSFDYKNISGLDDNQNYVPTYETWESLDPINAFPSDDFFALMDANEGNPSLNGGVDVAIGRLTVRNSNEARDVVNKIIRYETSALALGDWRNRMTHVADDEDFNTHLVDANRIADKTSNKNRTLNTNKIFLDAYPQVATPGGSRFPDVQNAINNDIFKGVLVMNYMGHGSTKGWTQERVLTSTDIGSWNNTNQMPLLVTGTCTFAAYDDPTNTSAGEQTLLKENGGAIALITTTRPVYASYNAAITGSVFDTLFQKYSREPLIGEILRISKNTSDVTNSRKFVLLGDPALKLAVPKYDIATTKINTHDVADGKPDTLRALQKITIEGVIQRENGQILSTFNGKIFPTIFDKIISISTLGQDPSSPKTQFTLQKNVIFKGAASVVNGVFKFSFVVPKDINYRYGFAKISYYAHDSKADDATGFYENIVVGGTDANAVADNKGPKVEVFMNDDKFVFGGKTDQNPSIYAKISDETGINITGTTIGHDLTGALDEGGTQTYILNDFYQSKLDDYTLGEVRYPLHKIATGSHRVRVKAWDVSNNSGEGSTEFLVAEDAQTALRNVLNYPNPFTTKTSFQFEHGYSGQLLDVQVRIFTVAGKLVKTLNSQQLSESNRISGIEWDGKDDYGDSIGRGVYVYKVLLQKSNDRRAVLSESAFEKLVILK